MGQSSVYLRPIGLGTKAPLVRTLDIQGLQAHKEEPGKRNRPALIIRTDLLNSNGPPPWL
jgi:hypothetical protein